MKISKEMLIKLKRMLTSEPTPGGIEFINSGQDLSFKILNGNDIHLSAVFRGTLIVDFDVKEITICDTKGLFIGGNCTISIPIEESELPDKIWINERECELLMAMIDHNRQDVLIENKGQRRLKADYKSNNGGWLLQYDNDTRAFTIYQRLTFMFDSVDVVKKYVRLYNAKYPGNRIYISRSRVSPF